MEFDTSAEPGCHTPEVEQFDEGLDLDVEYRWLLQTERDLQELLGKLDFDVVLGLSSPPETCLPDTMSTMESDESLEDVRCHSEDDRELWRVEAIKDRKRWKGELYYLVKWRGHPHCSWELGSDLEEDGYVAILDEYDACLKEKAYTEPKKVRPQRNPQERRKAKEEKKKKKKKKWERLSPPLPEISDIIWKDTRDKILGAYTSCGVYVTGIYDVINHTRLSELQKLAAGASLEMLFHGTALSLIRPIVRTGLRVPNTGPNPIRVRNGSALGVGIYTATTPSISMQYTGGCQHMLVCAGLTSSSDCLCSSSSRVFRSENLVVPVYVVTFQNEPYLGPIRTRPMPFAID